jgi:glucokinase
MFPTKRISKEVMIPVPLAREVKYVRSLSHAGPFFLAADIGGTNSNFGVFTLAYKKPLLLLSLHYKSKDISDFTALIQQVEKYCKHQYSFTFQKACIGAAGIIYPLRASVRPTNLSFTIDLNDIMAVTTLEELLLINDFEAVALGVELLSLEDLVVVQQGVERIHANKAFLGAGTGLGKCILTWHVESERYLPVASEGGHADASFYTDAEWNLAQFIYTTYSACPISWEDVLSGAGLQKIYRFLGTLQVYPETDISREIEAHDVHPDRISYYAELDARCKDTFDMYVRLYARCAKNFVLDALALNGIYIGGGIAAKNVSMFFDTIFRQEFVRCGKHARYLTQVPVYIIANYNVSLYGAVRAAYLREQELL